MNEDNIKFTKISLEKSKNFSDDPLIKFVILWIGFNALYGNNDGREKEKIFQCLDENKEIVEKLLRSKNAELLKIVSFVNRTSQHYKISEFIENHRAFLEPGASDNIRHFSQFINKIRNNMFHSGKSWNQEDEAKLLEMVNPIIMYMLSEFIQKFSER